MLYKMLKCYKKIVVFQLIYMYICIYMKLENIYIYMKLEIKLECVKY